MARMSPDERRDAIVSATLAVMQRRGIAATTVRDVAAEMGTSSGLIHHYYESMDDLVAEAFARAAGLDLEATVAATAGGDPVQRLARFLATYNRVDEDSAMQLWLDAWAEAARRPALRRTSRRLNEAWQEQLAQVIADGVAHGQMTCDDADAAAWRLLSMLDGLALQTVAHGDAVTREQAARWSRESAERELGLVAGSLDLAAATSPAPA